MVESNTDPPSLIQHTTAERKQQAKQQQPIRRQGNSYIKDLDIGSQLDHLKALQVQGRWLEWSQQMRMDLNWNSLIYNWSDAELRFALQAVTDTAPTPTNLRRWDCREVDPCMRPLWQTMHTATPAECVLECAPAR